MFAINLQWLHSTFLKIVIDLVSHDGIHSISQFFQRNLHLLILDQYIHKLTKDQDNDCKFSQKYYPVINKKLFGSFHESILRTWQMISDVLVHSLSDLGPEILRLFFNFQEDLVDVGRKEFSFTFTFGHFSDLEWIKLPISCFICFYKPR